MNRLGERVWGEVRSFGRMSFHLSNVAWPNSSQATIHIPEDGLKPKPRRHLGNDSVMVGRLVRLRTKEDVAIN